MISIHVMGLPAALHVHLLVCSSNLHCTEPLMFANTVVGGQTLWYAPPPPDRRTHSWCALSQSWWSLYLLVYRGWKRLFTFVLVSYHLDLELISYCVVTCSFLFKIVNVFRSSPNTFLYHQQCQRTTKTCTVLASILSQGFLFVLCNLVLEFLYEKNSLQ